MADLNSVQYWRVRTRNFAFGGVACVISVFLLKAIDATFVNEFFVVAWLFFVLFFLAGLYCTHRHWLAFKAYEIASGSSVEAAREKWRKIYPPTD